MNEIGAVHVWLPENKYAAFWPVMEDALRRNGLFTVKHSSEQNLEAAIQAREAKAAVVPWENREIGKGYLPVAAIAQGRSPYDGKPHFWFPAGWGRNGHGIVRMAQRFRALALASQEEWLWRGHVGLHPGLGLLWQRGGGEWGKTSVLRPLTARIAAVLWNQPWVPVETLYEEIWGAGPVWHDQRLLDVHLSWLRRAIGEDAMLKRSNGVVILQIGRPVSSPTPASPVSVSV